MPQDEMGAVLTLGANQNAKFNDKVAYKMLGCVLVGYTICCGVMREANCSVGKTALQRTAQGPIITE